VNSRLIVMYCSSDDAKERWLAVSQDAARVGGVGGQRVDVAERGDRLLRVIVLVGRSRRQRCRYRGWWCRRLLLMQHVLL
jgi:hypothetical protein